MNCTNAKGFSPLHEAVLMNNFEAVEVLIKLGVDLNFPVQANRYARVCPSTLMLKFIN